MLRVELDNNQSVFRPGSILSGRIFWEMSQAPDTVTATLTWSTEGKGDDDGDIAVEQSWQPQSESGSQAFRWQLPRGPLSLDAKLIRIRWTIECSTEKPSEDVTVPIVLSHLDRPIILKAI